MSRREKLSKMLETEPRDVFLNYALAMELLKDGPAEQAVAQFDRVIALDENYVAAYLQKAQALMRVQRIDEAKASLKSGIVAAKAVGDRHAEEELAGILGSLD